jgi:hypothetical protein
MAKSWHTHAQCIRFTCLSDSMRWDRTEEKCTDSLIMGSDAAAFNTTASHPYCSYDVDMGGTSQIYKYITDEITAFQVLAQATWRTDAKIDDMVNYF